jgi:hypothetical protein
MSNFVEILDKDGVPLGQLPVSKEGGRLRNIVYMTESGTYEKPSWLKFVRVKGVGGGGGSAGPKANNASQYSIGGPGAGGAYFEKTILAELLDASTVVTVGLAGTAGAAEGDGGSGGVTSFGMHATASGGTKGTSCGPATAALVSSSALGGIATGGDINIPGQSSSMGYGNCSASLVTYALDGGNSVLGVGGRHQEGGKGYGAGGGGRFRGANGSAQVGFAGGPGIVIIEEYE